MGLLTAPYTMGRLTIPFTFGTMAHYGYLAFIRRMVGPGPLDADAHGGSGGYEHTFAFRWYSAVFIMAVWWCTCWTASLLYEFLDRKLPTWEFLARYKLFTAKGDLSFAEIAPVALRNEMVTILIGLVIIAYAPLRITDLSNVNFSLTILYFLGYLLGYDVVFFVGHRWMHSSKEVFDATHAFHHSSHATKGCSNHYMKPLDYLWEVMLPATLPMFVLGLHPPALAAFLTVGGWNGITVHSGWNFPLSSDPRDHFLHHVNYSVNFALGPCDLASKTYRQGSEQGFKTVDDIRRKGKSTPTAVASDAANAS